MKPPLRHLGPLLAVVALTLAASVADAKGAGPAPSGVVVVSVTWGERGQEAGVKPGDVLREARAGKTRLPLDSPFALWRAEHDVATLRAVRLTLRRGAKTLALTLQDTDWGLRVRPALEDVQAASWQAAVAAKDDAPAEALAQTLLQAGAPLSAAWLWVARGEEQARTRQPEQAGASFARAHAAALTSAVANAPGIVLSQGAEAFANVDDARRLGLCARALAALPTPAVRQLQATVRLATALRYQGKLKEAHALLSASVPALRKLAPGRLITAEALTAQGSLLLAQGELQAAESLYVQASAIQERRAPHSTRWVDLLENRAMIARRHANLDGAQSWVERALALSQESGGNPLRLATAENLLGLIAKDRGDYERAQVHYRKAADLFEAGAGESLTTAGILHNLGNVAAFRHDDAEAERAFRRSLAIREELVPGSLDLAASLNALGELTRRQGKLDASDRLLRQALAIKARLAPGSLTYANTVYALGETAPARGLWKDAAQRFHQAAAIKRRFAPDSGALAEMLDGEARALDAGKDAAGARKLYAAAVAALEAQRGGLLGSEDQRSRFSSHWAAIYQHWAENLVRSLRFDEAFAVAERSHASGLLALLAEKQVLPRNQAPPALLAQEAANNAAFDRAQAQLAHASGRPAQVVNDLTAQLAELRQTRERLEGEIRQSSPKLAALTNPTPRSAASLRALLPEDTALLELSVGEHQSLLFVLTRDRLTVHTVAITEEALEGQVRTFRSFIERGRTHPAPEAPLLAVGQSLFDTLLRPALADAPQAKRWVVVPDGPLHLLPFNALVVAPQPLEYLAQTRSLTLAPSATVYAELLAQAAPATRKVIAFGDPPHPPQPRLAQSRREVANVAALFPGAQTHLGANADERTVLAEAAGARYLHFATHARFDPDHGLDSALLLALPAKTTPGNNGLLQAWEVAQKLTLDASLVTLSGCDTGLGAVVAGEGLMGLARAFQYAGARAVVVSLWEVTDGATAALMTRFYQGLRQGLPKDQALSAAEALVRADPATRHPYYWAAFQLNGDPRPDQW
jgi:CHAT domain-containing protein/Tfp pilus assembly protein PilF